ncbi:MAG: hypothetical protein JWN67_167 [Actinomycetia bacterium]|nr:hypothetical protein [Actinomycetes bacterium]
MRPRVVKNRAIAGVAVLAVVLALVGLAVVAGRDSGGTPATLPVLGAGGAGASTASPAMADSKMRIAPVTYEAGKLPGLADEADAWTLAPGGADEARIAELAKLLDVDGPVTKTETGWAVGTETRRLDVQDVAGLPWSLYETVPEAQVDPAPPSTIVCIKAPCNPPTDTGSGTSGCPAGAMCKDAPAPSTTTPCPPNANCASTSVATPACAPDAGCPDPGSCAADGPDCPMVAPERPADLPSKADAEAQGRKLLTKLGVDLDAADVKVDDGFTLWNVTADPVVGGLPTIGLTSSIGIGSKGVVQYANGWLGEVTKGDTYPLIGTAAGVDRLNAEQNMLMIAPNIRCDGCEAQDQVEPRVVRVTGVRLGLQVFSTYEKGAIAYLVPTYLFSTEDGGEIPVVAVADQYLGQQSTPTPDDHGTPAEPGDSGSGTCSGAGTTKEVATELSVQVCGPTTAKVGEAVTFTVSGKGQLRDDCGSPVPEWGDGTDVAVCDIGCASLPGEPREISKDFEHTYEKAGTYRATFHLRGCGADSGEDQQAVTAEVRVEG